MGYSAILFLTTAAIIILVVGEANLQSPDTAAGNTSGYGTVEVTTLQYCIIDNTMVRNQ